MKTFAQAMDDEIAGLGSKHSNLKPYLERIKDRAQHKIDSHSFLKGNEGKSGAVSSDVKVAAAEAPKAAPQVVQKPAEIRSDCVQMTPKPEAKIVAPQAEKSVHFSSKAGEMDVTISRNKDGSAMLTKEGQPIIRVAGVELGGNMTLKTFAERFGDKLTQGWANALGKKLGIDIPAELAK